MLRMIVTPREILCFSRVGDLWHGIISCKSQVSELKNWMPKHSKKTKQNKQTKPSFGVELRAGGDTKRSEKPGWSAGNMR